MVAGAAAATPLLGGARRAHADGSGADVLFQAGNFEAAGRAYEEILKTDPNNVHAARQRGYVGLLGNKFPDAEKYLTMALDLAPDDKQTNRLLGDCYTRQDKFALAVPHWRAAGQEDRATWFAAVRGTPYQIHGDTARLPWQQMDPFPLVEATVNGGPPKLFTFYTGAPHLGLSERVAEEAGLRAVAKTKIDVMGDTIWMYFGILDSFKLGGIELRNIPVSWMEEGGGPEMGDGMIGSWILYHLLPTFDYAGRSLILRRRTPEAARKARADATRAGAKPLPLWLAREQYLHSKGSVAGSGPRIVAVNLGGTSECAAGIPGETVKQLRIRTDHDRPLETLEHSQPVVAYPCYPNELRLGDATAKQTYCNAIPKMPLNEHGFDVPARFFHSFWKPYNIPVDYTNMTLYITHGKTP